VLANSPSRQVKSVQKALELLGHLQEFGHATPKQLTEELSLSKSSVHNYLATLEMNGYVESDNGMYRLGLRFLTHGSAAKSIIGNKRPITRAIGRLAEEFSQPIWWITEENGRGYFVEGEAPDDASKMYGRLGKRSYLHTHAPGKAILALCSRKYVERISEYHGLPEQTPRTTTDIDALQEELTGIQNREFAVSEGENILGILSVGTAFEDGDGQRHAIGVFGHSRNFAGNRANNIGRQLVSQVRELERILADGGQ
jgi:DNA-binding IclR family transcriptional regulator